MEIGQGHTHRRFRATGPSPGAARREAPAPRANPPHREIRVPKAAELIAETLRRRIVLGELKAGDALPPEADMMVEFNVSRASLREAFRVLEAEALIEVKSGPISWSSTGRPWKATECFTGCWSNATRTAAEAAWRFTCTG
ncbi:MAG: winged helix-turn-helix transcriptional regulator [Caulobacteraceae bacterium]|nr:winged helix-turn-helix transcriptional regulator [Caulobacteraceae bacterium]